MATKGTPNPGLDELGTRIYINGPAFTLVAYQNAADSLGASTVYADLVEPATANGYAPILLDGTWSVTSGVMGYVHSTPPHPVWTATGTWGSAVNGAAMIYGTAVVHFMDLDSPFIASAGVPLTVDVNTVIV